MKKAIFAFLSFFAFFATVASAQIPDFTYTNRVINQGSAYLTTAVTILMVLMTVWFLIAVFNFIRAKEPEDIKKYKKQMINGLIGLFVAVGVWGIIALARNITGVNVVSDSPNITCPPGYSPGLPGTAAAGTCVRR